MASAVVGRVVRASDTAARYGGEEFVIALPNADSLTARGVAERLRSMIETETIDVGGGRHARITASFGVAMTGDHGVERASLLRAADKALYDAKQRGRNRVIVASRAS